MDLDRKIWWDGQRDGSFYQIAIQNLARLWERR